MIYDSAGGLMSRCLLQVISPAGVVRNLDRELMQTKLSPVDAEFLVIVGGGTYQIREVLKSLGFRWKSKYKVWYHAGDFTTPQSECFARLANAAQQNGIWVRYFAHRDKAWRELI